MFNVTKKSITEHDKDIIIEISPAQRLCTGIYNHCLQGHFFNEYLAYVSGLKGWTCMKSGVEFIYYLNNMILTIDSEGKQSCYTSATLEDSFWLNKNLIGYDKLDEDIFIKNCKEKISNPDLSSSGDESDDEDAPISLQTYLRCRIVQRTYQNEDLFPPSDKYHHLERRVYRTYVNADVEIHFEILRNFDCLKEFEELLLPKPGSRFVIRMHTKNLDTVAPYIKPFTIDLPTVTKEAP